MTTSPHYQDDRVTLHHGDALDILRTIPDASIDAVVTDPPYNLSFMGKGWDNHVDGKGFQAWCELWAVECLRVLKPGGHILAFGGSRTWHRLASAVEDAGFEIRDSIAWLYGSGFPKSHDVSKAIDKGAGAKREVIGTYAEPNGAVRELANRLPTHLPSGQGFMAETDGHVRRDITAPATPAAEQWQGWGTALKPSHEPVMVARKPAGHSATLVEIGSHLDRLEIEWQAQEAALRTRTGAADGSPAPTGTSPSESPAHTFSSTVTSWRKCWAVLCEATNTSITATTSSTTIDLRTLSSSLGKLTAASTLTPETSRPGLTPLASAVDSLFASAVCAWRATLALSAAGSATASTPIAHPAADETPRSHFSSIVVGRKPIQGTVAGNVLGHGTGALNIDGCRVRTDETIARPSGNTGFLAQSTSSEAELRALAEAGAKTPNGRDAATALKRFEASRGYVGRSVEGRWPANVVLDDTQAAALDQQTGVSRSSVGRKQTSTRAATQGATHGGALGGYNYATRDVEVGYSDQGGASRFFPTFRYQAKAPTRERVKTGDGVAHPTVKPLDLMRWLVRLVTPPGGVVLEPFAGSGTTVEACLLEGFRCVAIEREADYLPLIEARLARSQPTPVVDGPTQGTLL